MNEPNERRVYPCHAQAALGLSVLAGTFSPALFAAKDDVEFVQEHLPEVAMDNRYATLPLWSATSAGDDVRPIELQSAFSRTRAGNLEISGPLLSLGARWRMNDRWSFGAFVFYDDLHLSGDHEERDLQTLFAPSTPIVRPVAASFTNLDGFARDVGLGVNSVWHIDGGWLGNHEWLAGVLWQKVELSHYRFDYVLEAGPQRGASGTIDFDANYEHVVPFVGLALPRDYGDWTMNAHVLVAYPLPRRGVVGHITGPAFDIRGDTADVGNGKHFGDPSVTFGYTMSYRPAHVSIDVGSLVTQGLLESRVHRGIDSNLLLSLSVGF